MLAWTDAGTAAAHAAARNLIEKEAARRPGSPELQRAWGLALGKGGDLQRAADVLRAASTTFPDHQPLKAALADALGRLGAIDAALDLARAAAGQGWARDLELRLLARSGRFDETARLEEQVASTDPWHPAVVDCRMRRLRKRPDERLRYCNALLAARPGNARALYSKMIALVQTGQDEAAAALSGMPALLHRERLAVPPGFSDRSRFLQRLVEEVLGDGNLGADPVGHATRDGLRTRGFPRAGNRASEALIAGIRSAVTAYAGRLSGDHPFVQCCPAQATLNAWALIFRSSARQELHCHPDHWVTGVFYAAVPQTGGDGGAIRLGEIPAWAGVTAPWPVLTIKPEPGTLLIFPSFLPHRTVPTDVEAPRIAVAFDAA